MAELIFFDAEGNEVERRAKTKGRPPKGSVKQDNGDFHVYPVKDVDSFKPEYVVLDESGNVISRQPKGRGRAKPNFSKMEDGEFKGHWVKIEKNDSTVVSNDESEVFVGHQEADTTVEVN